MPLVRWFRKRHPRPQSGVEKAAAAVARQAQELTDFARRLQERHTPEGRNT